MILAFLLFLFFNNFSDVGSGVKNKSQKVNLNQKKSYLEKKNQSFSKTDKNNNLNNLSSEKKAPLKLGFNFKKKNLPSTLSSNINKNQKVIKSNKKNKKESKKDLDKKSNNQSWFSSIKSKIFSKKENSSSKSLPGSQTQPAPRLRRAPAIHPGDKSPGILATDNKNPKTLNKNKVLIIKKSSSSKRRRRFKTKNLNNYVPEAKGKSHFINLDPDSVEPFYLGSLKTKLNKKIENVEVDTIPDIVNSSEDKKEIKDKKVAVEEKISLESKNKTENKENNYTPFNPKQDPKIPKEQPKKIKPVEQKTNILNASTYSSRFSSIKNNVVKFFDSNFMSKDTFDSGCMSYDEFLRKKEQHSWCIDNLYGLGWLETVQQDFDINYEEGNQFGVVADFYTDYFAGKGLELLTDKLYDKYNFVEQFIDLGFDFRSYLSEYYKTWVELFLLTRARVVWGNEGILSQTNAKPTKLGIARTETENKYKLNKGTFWLRELWAKFTTGDKLRTKFKVGYFPYRIGYGVSLGNAYKVGRIIPGQWFERFVDQFRPGILVEGTAFPRRAFYELYLGFINSEDDNLAQTTSFTRANQINKRSEPWRSSGVNNLVFSILLQLYAQNRDGSRYSYISPYLVVNKNDGQQVELPDDAKMTLGIFGTEFKFKTPGFKVHVEGAKNFGTQKVSEIDRNQFFAVGEAPQQSYLFEQCSLSCACTTTDWTSATHQTNPQCLAFDKPNGAEFEDDCTRKFKNAYNRFRNGYENSLSGWMILGDISLTRRLCNRTHEFVLGGGIASGDRNPNDSIEKLLANRFTSTQNISCPATSTQDIFYLDFDKKYSGFAGVQQMYMNCPLQPQFILEAQKLSRGLSHDYNLITTPEFSNLIFWGVGYKFKYRNCNHKVIFDFNLIGYRQPYQTCKGWNYSLDTLFGANSCIEAFTEEILPELKTDAQQALDKNLAYEVNAKINYRWCKNLSLYAVGAAFIPNKYYDDAKNKYIPLAAQFAMSQNDYTGYEDCEKKYSVRLCNQNAYFLDFGLEYFFDFVFSKKSILAQ